MEPYRESPLHGLTCGGLSLFRKIGLCAFSVEPLMTGLAFDGFGIQTLLHLESNGMMMDFSVLPAATLNIL